MTDRSSGDLDLLRGQMKNEVVKCLEILNNTYDQEDLFINYRSFITFQLCFSFDNEDVFFFNQQTQFRKLKRKREAYCICPHFFFFSVCSFSLTFQGSFLKIIFFLEVPVVARSNEPD